MNEAKPQQFTVVATGDVLLHPPLWVQAKRDAGRVGQDPGRVPSDHDREGQRRPVAFLSYAYGYNGHDYPAGQTWRANKIDEGKILADARGRVTKAGFVPVVGAAHHPGPAAVRAGSLGVEGLRDDDEGRLLQALARTTRVVDSMGAEKQGLRLIK